MGRTKLVTGMIEDFLDIEGTSIENVRFRVKTKRHGIFPVRPEERLIAIQLDTPAQRRLQERLRCCRV